MTWNCQFGAAVTKAEALGSLAPDVTVLQECAKPERADDASCLWSGTMTHKGIAAMTRAPYRLRACAAPPAASNSFLACTVVGPVEFNLLAVWAHPNPSYVGDLWTALDAHRDWFAERPTVIAGDFNSHPRWDRPGMKLSHRALEQRLSDEFGLVSAWHAAHPRETEPGTFYQRRNGVQEPFHIDYCFIPKSWTERLRRVTIGSLVEYQGQSDHRPLMIDVDL